MIDLSIVILNFNTKDYLRTLLDSVQKSDFGSLSYEIIVVDNASVDGSQDMVKKEYKSIRLVKNNKNYGFAKANNIGARFAKGKYLLFLNSDTKVDKGSIASLYQCVDQSKKYVGGTAYLELTNGKLDSACHRGFPTPWNAFCYFSGLEKLLGRVKPFGGYHQKWQDLKLTHEVECISGACFLIKKDVFVKMHGWDESFFMYGEDIDLCYRLRKNGYKLVFCSKSKIVHFKKRSGREKKLNKKNIHREAELKKRTKDHFFYTMRLFYEKHYHDKYPKPLYKLVLLGIKTVSKFKS